MSKQDEIKPPPPRTPGRPRVLIITASVGAGHNSVARALAAQFQLQAPQVEVLSQDSMHFVPWAYRIYYAGGYTLAVTRFPRCYGLGYWMSNHPQRPGRGRLEKMRLWVERCMTRRLLEYVRQAQPDLVLHTHFLAPPVLGRAIERGQLAARQVAVVTDIEVHRLWYSENVERWFAPSDYSAQTLRRWGIEDSRIKVTGIPIHPKWSAKLDRQKVLADWRLPGDRPIVLLSGGTDFLCVPVTKVARALLDALPQIHLVVLAGRNKGLLADLAKFPEAASRLTGLGFTDRVHELVEVSSLMLTKPGGATTAECLAKGLPMVLMNPVYGQEGGNARYLTQQGAAVVARGVREIIDTTVRLVNDNAVLSEMSAAAHRLPTGGVEKVVSACGQMLGL